MKIALGYHAVHGRAIYASPELAARLASLVTDARWPWQPSIVRPEQIPGRPLYPWPKGKLPAAKLPDTIRDIVLSTDTLGITLVASRQDAGNHAWLDIRTGHPEHTGYYDAAFAFDARTLCRAHGLPDGKSIEPWLHLLDEMSILLDTPHAVIWADENESAIISRLYGTGSPRPDMAVDSTRYDIVRANRSRAALGSQWIHPPAWGTYLKPAHVAAVGGRERIIDVVRPAVVRDVGALFYVQLSEHVDDALLPETEARRRAFRELLEPITVPRLAATA